MRVAISSELECLTSQLLHELEVCRSKEGIDGAVWPVSSMHVNTSVSPSSVAGIVVIAAAADTPAAAALLLGKSLGRLQNAGAGRVSKIADARPGAESRDVSASGVAACGFAAAAKG